MGSPDDALPLHKEAVPEVTPHLLTCDQTEQATVCRLAQLQDDLFDFRWQTIKGAVRAVGQ